ncbi:MAG: hypothetical protein J3K34DRAFT_179949 [Monoraphidium minutum]|nr:MAG: hypothetical protein J3K34DRAFT_179949 [Monoraphidium minutum]
MRGAALFCVCVCVCVVGRSLAGRGWRGHQARRAQGGGARGHGQCWPPSKPPSAAAHRARHDGRPPSGMAVRRVGGGAVQKGQTRRPGASQSKWTGGRGGGKQRGRARPPNRGVSPCRPRKSRARQRWRCEPGARARACARRSPAAAAAPRPLPLGPGGGRTRQGAGAALGKKKGGLGPPRPHEQGCFAALARGAKGGCPRRQKGGGAVERRPSSRAAGARAGRARAGRGERYGSVSTRGRPGPNGVGLRRARRRKALERAAGVQRCRRKAFNGQGWWRFGFCGGRGGAAPRRAACAGLAGRGRRRRAARADAPAARNRGPAGASQKGPRNPGGAARAPRLVSRGTLRTPAQGARLPRAAACRAAQGAERRAGAADEGGRRARRRAARGAGGLGARPRGASGRRRQCDWSKRARCARGAPAARGGGRGGGRVFGA